MKNVICTRSALQLQSYERILTISGMNPNVDITRFGVAIIESLATDEPQMGSKLYDEVLMPLQAADETLFYDLYKVKDVCDLKTTIETIIKRHKDNEMLALHFETHGCEEGVQLASGEIVPWKVFLNYCRAVNEELGGLLNVTTAMCYSIPLIADIMPSLRAPFNAIVITRRDVSVDEIKRGYSTYFQIYRNCLDIGPAKDAMRQEVNDGNVMNSPFEMITASWLFDQITNPDNNPIGFPHVVNHWFCVKKSQDPSYTKERVEEEIRGLFKVIAEKGKDYYLYKDLYVREK